MQNIRKPLEGIKVIELANYVAAPIVCRICADLGAEVIKLEGRGGDAWRATSMGHTKTGHDENPLFDIFNVGKKSISLNLKSAEGKEIFHKLLEDADILVTNTRNQSLVKLGLDYDSLKDKYPRLIYATLTGYGYEGPDCNAPGFDNIAFWSRSGFSADMTFDAPGSYPVNSRYAMGDTIAGTTLFGGVMTALYQREKTGKGDFVTMSLYNAGIWAFGGSIVMAEKPYCHEFPEKRNFGVASNLPYRCADGEWIRCTFFEFERYSERFFGALGIPEVPAQLGIVTMADAMAAAETLVPMLEKAFLAKTSAEWLKIFRELDIVCGKINHFADVLEDEQAWANDYIQTYQCRNGAERILPTCPVRLGSQGAIKLGAPMLYGEHNDSPDECPAICDEYAEKDYRVVVIHKENGGLSDARNAGLDIARGEYIGFVDSDDWIHPQMYEILIHFLETLSADVAQGEFLRFDEGASIVLKELKSEEIKPECIMASELIDNYYPNNHYRFVTTVCNKVYKRSVYKDIRFPVGRFYEDSHIYFDTLECTNKIVRLDVPMYHYLQRKGSIMHSTYKPQWFQSTYYNNKRNITFFREKDLKEQIDYAVDDFLTRFSKDKFAVYFKHPEYKKEFMEVEQGFRRELWAILKNPKICEMKKLLAVTLIVCPKVAWKIAKKYFPECIYPFMR